MNGRRLILMVLLVAAAILLAAGPVAAKATRTEFTATETYVKDLTPGKDWYTEPNGEIYHLRENQQLYTVVASDPRVSGDEIITLNLDMKVVPAPVYITGPMWGTFHITNGGGTWEGTFTGWRDEHGSSYIEYVGSGGGGYTGLHIRVHNRRINPPNDATPFIWTGYILDPGK